MFIRQMLTPGVTQQTGEDNSGATYFQIESNRETAVSQKNLSFLLPISCFIKKSTPFFVSCFKNKYFPFCFLQTVLQGNSSLPVSCVLFHKEIRPFLFPVSCFMKKFVPFCFMQTVSQGNPSLSASCMLFHKEIRPFLFPVCCFTKNTFF